MITPLSIDSEPIAELLKPDTLIPMDIDMEEEDLEGVSKVSKLFNKCISCTEVLVAMSAMKSVPVTKQIASPSKKEKSKYMSTRDSTYWKEQRRKYTSIGKAPRKDVNHPWSKSKN